MSERELRETSPASRIASTKQRAARNEKRKPSRKQVCRCLCREVRHKLGLTLDDVATATKMSKANLSELERGSEVQITTCFKLAKFYAMPVDELWKPLRSSP